MTRPHLLSLATAVPRFRSEQTVVRDAADRLFDRETADLARLMPIYDNAGIDHRYSCMPLDWYMEPHGWIERTRLYGEHAVDLLCQAARKCLAVVGAAIVAAPGTSAKTGTGPLMRASTV